MSQLRRHSSRAGGEDLSPSHKQSGLVHERLNVPSPWETVAIVGIHHGAGPSPGKTVHGPTGLLIGRWRDPPCGSFPKKGMGAYPKTPRVC